MCGSVPGRRYRSVRVYVCTCERASSHHDESKSAGAYDQHSGQLAIERDVFLLVVAIAVVVLGEGALSEAHDDGGLACRVRPPS